MASYRVAYGKAASVNGNEVYVDLRKMGTGSDATTEFDLGIEGYKITTDRSSEEHMLPGIITQTLEVVTVWDSIKLDPLLTALANSSDGDYLLELKTSLSAQPFMITVLLPESFTVSDDAGKVTVKFTGTDGLSLLKNTLYNDDGVAYTDHATLKQHIENVQEKMLTWTRVNDLFTDNPTDLRLGLSMNATSVDDEDYSVFPPSKTTAGYERMRVHHRTFHKRNTDGVNEYYSAYDVLDSICKTLGVSVGTYGKALMFLPPQMVVDSIDFRAYYFNGTSNAITGFNLVQPFDGTIGTKTAYKGANWTRTYIAPVGKTLLTRVTQQSQGLIYSTQDSSGTTLYDADEIYNNGDELVIRGSVRITKSGSSSLSGPNRIYRFVPEFELVLNTDGGTQYYLNNNLTRSLTLNMTAVLDEGTGFENVVNYANLMLSGEELSVYHYNWETVASRYSTRVPMEDGRFFALHDARYDIDVVIPFQFSVEIHNAANEMQGASLTARLFAYDFNGQIDATYLNTATVNFIETGLYRRDKDQVQEADSFRYRAKQDSGRTDVDYGQTLIGDRGASTYFGGITVYDGSDWVASSGWVNDSQSTARTVNQLAVEEICAHHKRAKQIERGTIVHDSTETVQLHFLRYTDARTDYKYIPLRQVFTFTPQITDVTLMRIGRIFSGITTDVDRYLPPSITTFVKPLSSDVQGVSMFVPTRTEGVQQIYHNDARTIAEAWDTANVIGGATLEFYKTVTPDGIGVFTTYQREVKTSDQKIVRRIYINRTRLATDTDSGWITLSTQPADNDTLAEAIALLEEFIGTDSGVTYQLSVVISYEVVSIYDTPLDTYDDAQCAYGLRKLRDAYTGPCILLRNGTTGTQKLVGFTSGGLIDTADIATYCGSAEGFVVTWYDQSGNGRNITQSSTGAQPKIYDGSNTLTLNGRPAMDFDGSNDFLAASSNFNVNANVNEIVCAFVGSFDDNVGGNKPVSAWNSSQSNQVVQMNTTGIFSIRFTFRYSNLTLGVADYATALTAGAQTLCVGSARSGLVKGFFNDTEITGSSAAVAPNDASTSFAVGRQSNASSGIVNGMIQEVIIFSRATAENDAGAISDTLNDYFDTY